MDMYEMNLKNNRGEHSRADNSTTNLNTSNITKHRLLKCMFWPTKA